MLDALDDADAAPASGASALPHTKGAPQPGCEVNQRLCIKSVNHHNLTRLCAMHMSKD